MEPVLFIFMMIVVFVVLIILAQMVGQVAEEKGYRRMPWALATFFLGPLPVVLVAGLPDRHSRALLQRIAGLNRDHVLTLLENEYRHKGLMGVPFRPRRRPRPGAAAASVEAPGTSPERTPEANQGGFT